MRILVIEPKKRPYVKEIDGSDEALRKIIKGDLQIRTPFIDDIRIHLVCDEWGKIKKLPINRVLFARTGEINDIVSGTFCLYNTSTEGNRIDLTDEQIKFYTKLFKKTDLRIDKLKFPDQDDIPLLRVKNFNEPVSIWNNHQDNFGEEKVNVIVFESQKKPYVKEMVLDNYTINDIVGSSLDLSYGKTSDEYVIIRKINDIEFVIPPFELLTHYKEFTEIYEQIRGTYIACKVAEGKRGFVSFNEEEIEEYIDEIQKDDKVTMMNLVRKN